MGLKCAGLLVRWPLVAAVLFLIANPGAIRSQAATQAGLVKGSIGSSVLVLSGPWRFHPGDNLAWAQPDFDDSGWAAQDLTPPEGSYDPVNGSSGYVPGWTKQRFPKVVGYAWYRLRIELQSPAGASVPRLGLAMPDNFDDAYQIYVDGKLIGGLGRFGPKSVVYYSAQPRAFDLPGDAGKGAVTIAIRFWMDANTPLTTQDAGGPHGPPMLGEASAIDAMLRLEWDKINRGTVGSFLSVLSLSLVFMLGFTLYWLDRDEPAYLWLGSVCLAGFLSRGLVLTAYYTLIMPLMPESVILDDILAPLNLGLWALFWAYWFKLDERIRVARIAWTLTGLLMASTALVRPPLYGQLTPVGAASWLLPVALVFRLSLGVLLVWITYRGIQKRTADGWMALTPVLLTIFWAYQEELAVLHVPMILRLLGITISWGVIANLLMLGIVSILLMRRFILSQRERVELRLEIEQARQVQHVLIPEAIGSIPGYSIASEYIPAQQVGGDFFQILATGDGGVLAVIGDVSGKGTPAAMMVSLLVGTVRTLACYTNGPGEILTSMNERMCGRSQGGFTTCLVLRADRDGTVTAANAGHPAPYIQGREVGMENCLPLGLRTDSKYTESTFRLAEDEQLTLVTDGVVEARNGTGELFGFDRTAAIAAGSAESIARTAQDFGQNDDITVLTLKRVSAG